MDHSQSPTGLPYIPPKAVPYVAAAVALAGILVQVLPGHTMGFKIATGVVTLGSVLGVVSPGARKIQAAEEAGRAAVAANPPRGFAGLVEVKKPEDL